MDEKQINNCIIFETIAGSHAYGMNTPESDIDIRGACIPNELSYYFGFGLNKFYQKDSGWSEPPKDKVIYDLRKIMKLMADNNPNCIEMLWVDEKFHTKRTKYWERIVENREKFLSKNLRHRFSGYAYAQLKRIQRHRNYLLHPPQKQPERKDFGLPENNKVVSASEMGLFQWYIAKLIEDSLEETSFSESTKKELKEVNTIGLVQGKFGLMQEKDHEKNVVSKITNMPDEWVELIMRERRYSNALKEWNSFLNWKENRNPKRKELEKKCGYDSKHAAQLVRLERVGMEALEQGKINVYRDDADELLAIKNGAWTYEQIVEYMEKCEEKMGHLYETTKLPKNPDRKFIDNLCVEIIQEFVC